LRSDQALPGVMVRVREGQRSPQFDGMLGTITQTFGHPDYAAVNALLEDGRAELFWHHQLDMVEEITGAESL
jgi:hypothetical protein